MIQRFDDFTNEGFFSKSKDPKLDEIISKIKDAAWSFKTIAASKQGSFINGAMWLAHNLTQEEIEYLKENTDKDDFSFFGL